MSAEQYLRIDAAHASYLSKPFDAWTYACFTQAQPKPRGGGTPSSSTFLTMTTNEQYGKLRPLARIRE